jgi:hypothetical protein
MSCEARMNFLGILIWGASLWSTNIRAAFTAPTYESHLLLTALNAEKSLHSKQGEPFRQAIEIGQNKR